MTSLDILIFGITGSLIDVMTLFNFICHADRFPGLVKTTVKVLIMVNN